MPKVLPVDGTVLSPMAQTKGKTLAFDCWFFLSRSTRHLFYISPGYASEAEMNEDVVDLMVDAMIEGGSIRLSIHILIHSQILSKCTRDC